MWKAHRPCYSSDSACFTSTIRIPRGSLGQKRKISIESFFEIDQGTNRRNERLPQLSALEKRHANRVRRRRLQGAGFDRKKVYVTNVVKHFKWEPRGKRRIHKNLVPAKLPHAGPGLSRNRRDPACCNRLSGATAAQALLGKTFRVTASRGQFV